MEIIVFQVLVAHGLRSQISCTLFRPGTRVSQLTCTAFDYLSAGRYFTLVWQHSFSSPLPVLTLVPGQSIFYVQGYGHPVRSWAWSRFFPFCSSGSASHLYSGGRTMLDPEICNTKIPGSVNRGLITRLSKPTWQRRLHCLDLNLELKLDFWHTRLVSCSNFHLQKTVLHSRIQLLLAYNYISKVNKKKTMIKILLTKTIMIKIIIIIKKNINNINCKQH